MAYFNGTCTTRSRDLWGKQVAAHFDKIRANLLSDPPVRSSWMKWVAELCELAK